MSNCDVRHEIIVGIDWADKTHAFESIDPAGKRQHGSFEQSQAGVALWLAQWLKRFPNARLLIAVEATRGALINALMDYAHVTSLPSQSSGSGQLPQVVQTGRRQER